MRVLFVLVLLATSDGAPPFAVAPEAVSFSNGNTVLSGVIVKPAGAGPFPAVVMVHGNGPATHDEPAFRVHANAFVRDGFAVLLFDKRGSGKSTGNLDTSDYDDLAGDVAAGVRLLRARPDILPDKIGFLGRSEGAWIAALAASRDPKIPFVIMSSGSAVKPYDEIRWSTRTALRASGASPAEIEDATEAKAATWAFYRKAANGPVTAQEHAALQARVKSFARFASQIPQLVRDPAQTPPEFFRAFTRKIEYDPAPAFGARTAFLEVIGANDEVVEPASTIAALERMRQSGRDVTVKVLPGVGHSLVVMTKDGPRYPDDYPELAVRWARKRVENRVSAPAPFGVSITAADDFRYAGSQEFDFYGVAHAVQHFFVDADVNGVIRRMYWVQFENYLPSNQHRYEYPPPNDTLGALPVTVDTRLRAAGTVPSPDSDAGHAIAFLAARNLRFAEENLRARFIYLPGADKRSEVMIIYQEDVALNGRTVTPALVTRAKSGIRVRSEK